MSMFGRLSLSSRTDNSGTKWLAQTHAQVRKPISESEHGLDQEMANRKVVGGRTPQQTTLSVA
jgi:hypothetical protein